MVRFSPVGKKLSMVSLYVRVKKICISIFKHETKTHPYGLVCTYLVYSFSPQRVMLSASGTKIRANYVI